MGAGATKKENKIALYHGIKPEKIYTKDGAMYCNLEREEFKLNVEVLNAMDRYNSFSKDQDLEQPKLNKTKGK